MNPRRLYRSRDRQLTGVAGGMAEYLDVDPTIIRIGWILVTLVTGGLALIAYLLLALVIPQSPYPAGTAYAGQWTSQPTGGAWPSQGQYGTQPGNTAQPPYGSQTWSVPPTPAAPQWNPAYVGAQQQPSSRGLGAAGIIGILLIVIGAFALADIALPGLRIGLALGPAVILALGVALLISSVRRTVEPASSSTPGAVPPGPAAPATAASADPAAAWSSVPSDMTPWPSTQAQSTPPSSVPSADALRTDPAAAGDPDATQTDVPTVSEPGSEHRGGERG